MFTRETSIRQQRLTTSLVKPPSVNEADNFTRETLLRQQRPTVTKIKKERKL